MTLITDTEHSIIVETAWENTLKINFVHGTVFEVLF